MDEIEAAVHLPEEARLSGYTRYYAQTGNRQVDAVYVSGPNRRVWVAETGLPSIMDGGCGVISVHYDLVSKAAPQVECNGVA